MNRKSSKSVLAFDYVKDCVKSGITSPTAIAKKLLKDYPNEYNDAEHARQTVRRVMGKTGKAHQATTHKDFRAQIEQFKKEMPKGESERVDPYHLPKSCTRILVLSDIHIPYHDDKALFAALEYGLEKDVNCVYLNGDTMDMYQLSRHEKNPANRSFSYELDVTRSFLKGLRDMFPNAHIVYKVGNHCFEEGTEVLTSKGFIDFKEVTEQHLVAQFDVNKNISFANPKSIITNQYKGTLYEFSNNYTNQSVTDLHRTYIGSEIKLAKDVVLDDVKNIPFKGSSNNVDYNISDDMLRLLVWAVCDGCVVLDKKYGERKIRLQFKLSKERKIKELTSLLDTILETNSAAKYSLAECKKTGVNKLQPYYIRLYGDFVRDIYNLLEKKKQFPTWFLKLSERQTRIVIDTISKTDGSIHDGGITWITTSKNDIDVLQAACVINNISFNYNKQRKNASGFENGKQQYRARINTNNPLVISNKIEKKNYNGNVYCVEMPLGTVITRRNGKVAFSGNCERLEKFVKANPQIMGIQEFELSSLLNFTELRIHEVKSKQWAYAGKLPILHGHELPVKSGGVNPARTVQTKLNSAAIIGHFHRETTSTGKKFDEKPYRTFSSGCLCDLNPAYMPINDWTHGFMYVEIDKNGDYWVTPKTIIEGKIY